MAQHGLSRRVEGIGEGSVVGTLSKLLQLSCEAVLVFDGTGRVLLANEESEELLAAPGGAGRHRRPPALPLGGRRRARALLDRRAALPRGRDVRQGGLRLGVGQADRGARPL